MTPKRRPGKDSGRSSGPRGVRLGARKKFLFTLIFVLCAALLAEIGARVIEWRSPSACGRLLDPTPRVEGESRIFVYGGSTVNGYPDTHMGFANRLEAELNRPATRGPESGGAVRVYNFAAAGQDSTFARRSMERTIGRRPDLVIVLTGHNEFLRARVESAYQRISHRFALSRLVNRIRGEIYSYRIATGGIEEEPFPPVEYDRDSVIFKRKVEAFKRNLRSMIGMASANGVPLMILTPPSNLTDWEPVMRGLASGNFDEGYSTDLVRARTGAAEAAGTDESLAVLDGFLRLHPDDATALYLSGKTCQEAGRNREALDFLTRAKDMDPVPVRALSDFENAIRTDTMPGSELLRGIDMESGENRTGPVIMIDAVREFAKLSPGGLTGNRLIADNVHPTAEGYAIIYARILGSMKEHGIILGPKSAPPGEDSIRENIYADYPLVEGGARGLRTLELLCHANAHARAPFFQFEAADRYAAMALELSPGDWRAHATAAVADLMLKRVDTGVARLVTARNLKGSPLPLGDVTFFLNLYDALISRGVDIDGLVARGIIEP